MGEKEEGGIGPHMSDGWDADEYGQGPDPMPSEIKSAMDKLAGDKSESEGAVQ